MQNAFVNICNIPTRIITYGGWIEESLNATEIAIVITGNPGLPGFYTEFSEELHAKLNSKIPVWIIGHAGHDEPPKASLRQVPQLKGNEELFDLNSQIQHKAEFIRKYVPQNVKIHLIGHSIGAWMLLQLLNMEDIRSRIQKCYLLFPTIERMIESNNGWYFTKVALPLYWILGFIITLFNYLPIFLRLYLIQLYFWFSSIPDIFLDTALQYSKAAVTEKVVFLAEDEMACVRGLQRDIIEKNKHLLKFFYGTTDGWVPVSYYRELLNEFPDLDAQLDKDKIDHSFVLRYSYSVANIVNDMIRKETSLPDLK